MVVKKMYKWNFKYIITIIILIIPICIVGFIQNKNFILICNYDKGIYPKTYYINPSKHIIYDKNYNKIEAKWDYNEILFYEGINTIYLNRYNYIIHKHLRTNYMLARDKGSCTKHYFKNF